MPIEIVEQPKVELTDADTQTAILTEFSEKDTNTEAEFISVEAMEKLQSELSQLKKSSESDIAGVKSLQEKLDQLQAEYDNLYQDKCALEDQIKTKEEELQKEIQRCK